MGTFLLRLSSFVLVFTSRSIGGAGQDDEYCGVKRCNENGPIIRFPFRLKDQPDHCGYPGFELSCSRHHTLLEYHLLANTSIKGLQLSYSMKAPVNFIDYKSQRMYIINPQWRIDDIASTIQVHSPAAAAAISPFKFAVVNSPAFKLVDYTFFNCSSTTSRGRDDWTLTRPFSIVPRQLLNSLSSQNFQVYAVHSTLSTVEPYMISCTKMYGTAILSADTYYISDDPYSYASEEILQLSWSTPVCRICESKGEYCKLAANSTTSASTTTTCFPIPKPSDNVKIKRLVAGEVDSHNSLVY